MTQVNRDEHLSYKIASPRFINWHNSLKSHNIIFNILYQIGTAGCLKAEILQAVVIKRITPVPSEQGNVGDASRGCQNKVIISKPK